MTRQKKNDISQFKSVKKKKSKVRRNEFIQSSLNFFEYKFQFKCALDLTKHKFKVTKVQ